MTQLQQCLCGSFYRRATYKQSTISGSKRADTLWGSPRAYASWSRWNLIGYSISWFSSCEACIWLLLRTLMQLCSLFEFHGRDRDIEIRQPGLLMIYLNSLLSIESLSFGLYHLFRKQGIYTIQWWIVSLSDGHFHCFEMLPSCCVFLSNWRVGQEVKVVANLK